MRGQHPKWGSLAERIAQMPECRIGFHIKVERDALDPDHVGTCVACGFTWRWSDGERYLASQRIAQGDHP